MVAPSRRKALVGAVLVAAVVCVAIAEAQTIWRGGGEGWAPPKYPTSSTFAGGFNFCRGIFQRARYEAGGIGWNTDYPGADINFSVRLAELTRTRVTKQPNHTDPEYVVVRTTDQARHGEFQRPGNPGAP